MHNDATYPETVDFGRRNVIGKQERIENKCVRTVVVVVGGASDQITATAVRRPSRDKRTDECAPLITAAAGAPHVAAIESTYVLAGPSRGVRRAVVNPANRVRPAGNVCGDDQPTKTPSCPCRWPTERARRPAAVRKQTSSVPRASSSTYPAHIFALRYTAAPPSPPIIRPRRDESYTRDPKLTLTCTLEGHVVLTRKRYGGKISHRLYGDVSPTPRPCLDHVFQIIALHYLQVR